MHVAVSWQALAIASACLLGPAAAAQLVRRWLRLARAAWEAGMLLALFALWQLAGSHAAASPQGAWNRAWWIWHFERAVHLPSEAALQHLFLPYPAMVQAANVFYGALHFPVFIAFLVWLFTRHRDQYAHVRTTIVIFTTSALLIQLIPVAPPRMLHPGGMIDTGIAYGQSVYGPDSGFTPNQLGAMPSVHVGWALLIALAVVQVSRRRWRWLVLAYPVLTAVDVVITANHFWLDEIAAVILLTLALFLQRAATAAPSALADWGPGVRGRRVRPASVVSPGPPRQWQAAHGEPQAGHGGQGWALMRVLVNRWRGLREGGLAGPRESGAPAPGVPRPQQHPRGDPLRG